MTKTCAPALMAPVFAVVASLALGTAAFAEDQPADTSETIVEEDVIVVDEPATDDAADEAAGETEAETGSE